MAVDIDGFKRDLDQLKNQRSVIQAKLDEANRHVVELQETLKGMGFNTVEEAKQAYVKQVSEAEKQHELVKKLIAEINNVDVSIPSREDVMAKLNALSVGDFNVSQVQAEEPVSESAPVTPNPVVNDPVPANDFIQQSVIPATPVETAAPQVKEGTVDLSNMLFASL